MKDVNNIEDVIVLVILCLHKRDIKSLQNLLTASDQVVNWHDKGVFDGEVALELIHNAHSIIDEYRDLVQLKEAISNPHRLSHQEHIINFNKLQKMLENGRPYDPMKDAFSK